MDEFAGEGVYGFYASSKRLRRMDDEALAAVRG
jgi:hypothetical protein